jgi:ABC-type multidrug transport system fused ATPase/permease subunit
LNRIQSFLLCKDHESIAAGLMQENGIEMFEVSAAYESKKPRVDGAEMDAKTKDLIDAKWEAALLKSQLEEAEQKIKALIDDQKQISSSRFKRQSSKQESNSADDEWEDLDETTEPLVDPSAPDSDAIIDATATDPESGSSSSNLLCLKRVNFQCKEGELVAVVGFVGAGKSTLINTILGEVRVLSGTNSVRGALSYFSQAPFILNATVRDNILFGHVNDEEIDEERYQRALDCCALAHDLKILSHGDQTEIGKYRLYSESIWFLSVEY